MALSGRLDDSEAFFEALMIGIALMICQLP